MQEPEVWWNGESGWLYIYFPPETIVRCVSRDGTTVLFNSMEHVLEILHTYDGQKPVRLEVPVQVGSEQ